MPTTAEIIPFEPDAGNAVAGTRFDPSCKKENHLSENHLIKIEMMKISVNDKDFEIDENASIQMLITKTNSPQSGIAVAVNNSVIPKSEWDEYILQPNDNILIIKAAQGG